MKIVSGGQTGVDRAALDVALELGIPCGGWCPKGRLAEDGAIAPRYPLAETPLADYRQRTAWNVRDSDATLILNLGELAGGTGFTKAEARRLGKPCRVIDLDDGLALEQALEWLAQNTPEILNVAGPRESGRPGIHAAAATLLRRLLAVIGRAEGV